MLQSLKRDQHSANRCGQLTACDDFCIMLSVYLHTQGRRPGRKCSV